MKEEQIIVGGQAVIEGVMMRAPHSYAVAVRRPDGQIVSKGERLPSLAEKYPLLKLPVLRGQLGKSYAGLGQVALVLKDEDPKGWLEKANTELRKAVAQSPDDARLKRSLDELARIAP